MKDFLNREVSRKAEIAAQVENVANDVEKMEILSQYIGTSVNYLDKTANLTHLCTLEYIDPIKFELVYSDNGRRTTIDIRAMSKTALKHYIMFFERLLSSDRYMFTEATEYANMPHVIPFMGQSVRYEDSLGNTIIGVCSRTSDRLIEITGTTIINEEQVTVSRIVNFQQFAENGVIIDEEQEIILEPAKPEILGELQTIEEISEFILHNELTANQRSQISDYLIYRKTKPTGFKDIPEGQYSKVRFVDGLVEASFAEGETLESAVLNSKDYVSNTITELGQFKTQKGTVLNLNPNVELEAGEKEIVINLDEFEYKEVETYTRRLMEGNNLDSYTTAYDLSSKVLIEIDARIKRTTEQTLKSSLMKIKKALGIIVQAYFDSIDARISEEMVLEVENAMRDFINRPENGIEQERGEVRMVMVNGYTGSGKGTTLELLNAKASESGTDGIAGRGEGFEDYEQVMGPYDLARFAGEYIPNKLMRLLFATELINQRAKLDAEGRYTDPVYVSGFPRTDDQAKLFAGVEGIKAVSLNITPETAVFRVVRRMTQNLLLKNKGIRGDDLSDIALKDANGQLLTPEMLTELIRQLNEQDPITNVDMITPERIKAITDLLTLSAGARYHRYNSDKPKIEKAMSTLGVNVYQIQGDDLNPDQVTQVVRDYISGTIEA